MRRTHLGTVKAARRALEMVLADSELDKNPVPYFEPTNLGGLPDLLQDRERSAQIENDQCNRIRAASHLCLQAASAAMVAALQLDDVPINISIVERDRHLVKAEQRIHEFVELAAYAAAILGGHLQPPSDGTVSISRS